MPEKPEESQKTVMTVRWCDIFIFSNRPYPDVKRWYYTQNDAFILMLKSDFDQRIKKMKKNDIFFHSLWFLTLKYKIFSGTSGYRKWSKPLPRHNFNLCLCPQKKFGWISCLGRPWLSAPIFLNEKKTRHCEKLSEPFFKYFIFRLISKHQ